MNMNQVFLCGNLGKDPELRYTPGGTAVCQVSLAVNEGYKGKDGKWQNKTHWITIQLWGKAAEEMGTRSKGDQIMVSGSLCVDTWEKDGRTNYKTYVKCFRFGVVERPPRREEQPQGGPDVSNAWDVPGDDDIPF